jgi:hypothetical protein
VGGADLVVVIAPETSEEAGRLFAALLSAGFHPSMDYGGEAQLANYPILAPQSELNEAKAFLRGFKAAPKPERPPSMFDSGYSDRPVGPIPPWKLNETVGKALGVLGAMILFAGAIVALVYMLQFLTSLKGH